MRIIAEYNCLNTLLIIATHKHVHLMATNMTTNYSTFCLAAYFNTTTYQKIYT